MAAPKTAAGRPNAGVQDFLGGWWDARLADARTGSGLEGGLRLLVEEHYPGDPLDPNPTTWVPFVFYGPQPYPFQTPQVMVRERPQWQPSPNIAVGEVIEAIDDAEEADTVLWRGVVHKEKGKDAVRRGILMHAGIDGCMMHVMAWAMRGLSVTQMRCDRVECRATLCQAVCRACRGSLLCVRCELDWRRRVCNRMSHLSNLTLWGLDSVHR